MKTTEQNKTFNHIFCEDLYTLYYPTVKRYILKNNGTIEDSKDVFQDAIEVLLLKLDQDHFELTASIKTYLVAICKNIWRKQLRENSHKCYVPIENKYDVTLLEEIKIDIEKEKTYIDKLKFLMSKITKHCDDLLNKIYILKKKSEDLQNEFGYATKHNLQNQKYKCLQQIKKKKKELEKNK